MPPGHFHGHSPENTPPRKKSPMHLEITLDIPPKKSLDIFSREQSGQMPAERQCRLWAARSYYGSLLFALVN